MCWMLLLFDTLGLMLWVITLGYTGLWMVIGLGETLLLGGWFFSGF